MLEELRSIAGDPAPIAGTESFSSPVAEVQTTESLSLQSVSAAYIDKTNAYCPVYVDKKPAGGRLFTAYINSTIQDIDQYIDLIDTLLTATAEDTYLIYIDSPGGYVSSGSIVSSAIDQSKAEVFTIARGLCASAACLIHNSAKKGHALVQDCGVLMIHMSSHDDSGVSTQIAARAADQVRYVNENLLKQALDMGYITQEELASIQNGGEIFISSDEFAKRTGETK